MTFHVCAFYKNVPNGTAVTDVAPIADDIIAINPATTRFFVNSDILVFAAYAGGTSLERARIYTPWKLPNEIRPVNTAVLPSSVPPVASWLSTPVRIPAGQDIILDAVHSNAGAQDVIAVALLTSDGLVPRPEGELLTLRLDFAAGSFVAGLRAWTEPPVTAVQWEYALPPGRYAIVGSEFVSTTAIAHRWIVPGTNFRPGGLSQQSMSGIPSDYQMNGTLGNWGVFTSPLMPRFEMLCNATDAAVNMRVFLQVIPL